MINQGSHNVMVAATKTWTIKPNYFIDLVFDGSEWLEAER
ncbi:hypothetical protein JCM19239_1354 [Vibrio variabilis]|uniref:Uncharacterized protein n=1 Tax=Vibrio variabilis TaxID=990271 RepID=A0ABQ0JR49_9VIBR|nr:hypothetical protein JCM19239_1354 [Vibrio variabilis]